MSLPAFPSKSNLILQTSPLMMMMMMMMMMMKNWFRGMVERQKMFLPYFQPGPLSEIFTTANL